MISEKEFEAKIRMAKFLIDLAEKSEGRKRALALWEARVELEELEAEHAATGGEGVG
jgi:hypothetical protein